MRTRSAFALSALTLSSLALAGCSGTGGENPSADDSALCAAAAEPEMMWADETRLGRPYAKDPSVIRFKDRYLMYFSLPPFDAKLAPTNAPKGWSIGIAESADLTVPQLDGDVRVHGLVRHPRAP